MRMKSCFLTVFYSSCYEKMGSINRTLYPKQQHNIWYLYIIVYISAMLTWYAQEFYVFKTLLKS